jgi:hypothetical protein
MGDLAQIILFIRILHRICAIRFFVANMLPGSFANSGGDLSPPVTVLGYYTLARNPYFFND